MNKLYIKCLAACLLSSASYSQEQVKQNPLTCVEQTKIAGDIIIECNEKVKELDSHIKILTLHIKENEDYIAKQDKYINDLEKYAKDNDSQSWFSRNKLLFGFIGGILLTTGLVVGIGQIVK